MKTIWPVTFFTMVVLLFTISVQAATLEGLLNKSLKGVKHWLSCHCFNGIVILTEKNILQPVCLSDHIDVECKQLKFTGEFRENTNNPEPDSPCMKEMRNIFFAESVECTESDGIH
jgi:hypothetical protein